MQVIMWQEKSAQALKCMMNGDEAAAIQYWKQTLTMAEQEAAGPSGELGEVYYYLGKVLSNQGNDTEAVAYLTSAIEMLHFPGASHGRLDTARYELANILNRQGRQEAAGAQYKAALHLPESTYRTIALKQAIKELHDCGLARDLKGRVLTNLCLELGIDIEDNNVELGELLVSYYIAPQDGAKRAKQDCFFVEDYKLFEPNDVLQRLCQLIGQPGFLRLVHCQGDIRQGDWISLAMQRFDGFIVERTCSSVVGIVDEFSKQLVETGRPAQFYSLDINSCFAAYLMKPQVKKYLEDGAVLGFDS